MTRSLDVVQKGVTMVITWKEIHAYIVLITVYCVMIYIAVSNARLDTGDLDVKRHVQSRATDVQ